MHLTSPPLLGLLGESHFAGGRVDPGAAQAVGLHRCQVGARLALGGKCGTWRARPRIATLNVLFSSMRRVSRPIGGVLSTGPSPAPDGWSSI
jgi:hypothetical protein